MRRVMGLLVGFLLFFPGAMILRWLVVDALRLYQEMSLTDALLVMVIMLACAIIFGQPRRALTADELAFYDAELNLITEPGRFRLFIGTSSADVKEAEFELK